MSPDYNKHVWMRDLVINAYELGKRTNNIDSESDSWMKLGLEAMEEGKVLTVEMVKQFVT